MTTTAPTPPSIKSTNNGTSQQERSEAADSIVKKYALMGTATGLIPVFGIDIAAATAVQTKMVIDLADLYGYDLSDNLTSVALSNGITALGGRMLTGLVAGLAKSFSPLQSLVGGALSAAFAGFITAEIGRIYQARMEAGKHPAEITAKDVVEHIIMQLREGKFNPTNVKGQFGFLLNK